MRYLLVILSLFSGCGVQTSDNIFPKFKTNATLGDLNKDYRTLVEDRDLSIIIYSRTEGSFESFLSGYKIFSLNKGSWEKIEIKRNVFDQNYREKNDALLKRDITTTKICKKDEGEDFFSKLKMYGLFELPEKFDCSPTNVKDGGELYIQIVAGNEIRCLKYYDVYGLRDKCPQVEELINVLKIERLFEDEFDLP